MSTGRRTAVLLLALIYAAIGVLYLSRAAWPRTPDTPVVLLAALGLLALACAAVIGSRAGRFGDTAMHLAVALISLLIGVVAWRSGSAVGIVGLGPAMIAVEMFTAHVFPRRVAMLHTALLVGAATAGAVAARPGGFAPAWVALIGSVLVLGETQSRIAAQLRAAADVDPLTRVASRRAWETGAARHLAYAQRTCQPLSVAIIDLDDFKAVNDRQGHAAGDVLLRELSQCWSQRLRRTDLLGRYGGDEFVLCLPGTDRAAAGQVLEQLAAAHPFSWSVGVATAADGDTVDSLVSRADDDLYDHKRSRHGR